MTVPIQWEVDEIKLADLVKYPKNPRSIGGKKYEDLKKSVERFGLAEPVVINTDNTIIGGHARAKALAEMGVKTVRVFRASRPLAENEVEELNIRLNKNVAGDWDFNILADDFDSADLLDWGFEGWELGLADEEDFDEAFGNATNPKGEINQMTFHLTDAQKQAVVDALVKARPMIPEGDDGTGNRNGKLLAIVCEAFIGE